MEELAHSVRPLKETSSKEETRIYIVEADHERGMELCVVII